MNRLQLLESIAKLSDENNIHFFLGDKEISNRFDRISPHQIKKGDSITNISFALYSYIANAIILKAQGREKAEIGYKTFDHEWEEIILQTAAPANVKILKDEAMSVLHSFLFTNQNITLPVLIDKFSIICLLKEMKDNSLSYKKICHEYEKHKAVVTNQVTLFCRSLYHSFLNKNSIDPQKISFDYKALSNGLLIYNNEEIIIPTWQNAFNITDYKEMIRQGLLKASDDLSFSEIKTVSLLYLIKDITVSCTVLE